MILTSPLVHKVHHLLNLRHLLDLRDLLDHRNSQVRLDLRQYGLQLHHLLVIERG